MGAQFVRGLLAGACYMMTFMLLRFPGTNIETHFFVSRYTGNADRSYSEAWVYGFLAIVLTITSVMKAERHGFDDAEKDDIWR
jgi:hypothetical protein